jgi:hypothetical protein
MKVRGIGLYKSGYPRVFGPVLNRSLQDGNPSAIRLVLTLLHVSRLIPAWKPVDLSTVTAPSTMDSTIRDEFRRDLKHVLAALPPFTETALPDWKGLHVATTMGPIGPSMFHATSLIDEWIKHFGESKVIDAFNLRGSMLCYIAKYSGSFCRAWAEANPTKEVNLLRRLATVPDVDGKTRVIGILDYWSQGILKGLHDELMSIIEALKGPDVTYGQDIRPFGPETEHYHSIDLTAATDRFPSVITKDLLEHMYDRDLADAWYELMVKVPFRFEGKEYKYSTGQPMGAFSSWVSFSLTHHIIVQWAAMRVGLQLPFRHYRLLGDDIVIRSNAVAEEYTRIISRLGVEISPHKTLVSVNSFEFAKRFFYNGQEVTGFPLSGLINVLARYNEVVNVLYEASRRGYPLPWTLGRRTISHLYRYLRDTKQGIWKNYSFRFIERLNRKILTLAWLFTKGHDTNLLRDVLWLWRIPTTCNVSDNTLRLIAIECFAQIKANQILDGVRSQVRRINTYIRDKITKIASLSQADIEPMDVPLIKGLITNVSDMQGQMEDFRELSKSQDFEAIVFGKSLVPEINPEVLDSSRRFLRTLSSDANMGLRGFVL